MAYETKFDESGKPIRPEFFHGSGYKKALANYSVAKNKYNAKNLIEGSAQADAGNILSGTAKEQAGQLAGLNIAALGYGQGLGQTGKDIQRIKQEYEALGKQGGADPISSAIMNQKQGAISTASRQLKDSGVKGPAAAAALSSIGQKQEADIASSLYGQKMNTLGASRSIASNMLSGTTALMQGEKAANAKMPSPPETSGVMGTVICTELYEQGYLSKEVMIKDMDYGVYIRKHNPYVYVGYRLWAGYVVSAMKKSKIITKLVSLLAIPWARNMSGEYNLVGSIVSNIGEPMCGIIGKLSMKLGAKYVREIN